jgi:hypothetical protein
MGDVGTVGAITDEGIARLRSRIGIPQLYLAPPHYRRIPICSRLAAI